MKKIFCVLFLFFFIISQITISVRATPNIKVREYDVYQSGIKMGERKEIDEGVVSINGTEAKKITSYLINGQGEKAVYVNQTFYIDEKGLPLRTDVEVFSPTGKASSITIFSGKNIKLEVTVNNETKEYTIRAPEETYEDGILWYSLSYLPITEGYRKNLSVFASYLGARYDAEIYVTGKENLKVDGKEVECFVIELRLAQSTQPVLIYLRSSDLLLVKTSSGTQDVVIKSEVLV